VAMSLAAAVSLMFVDGNGAVHFRVRRDDTVGTGLGVNHNRSRDA